MGHPEDPRPGSDSDDAEPRIRTHGHLGTPEEAALGNRESPSSVLVDVEHLERPWGDEHRWAQGDEYAGTLIRLRRGSQIPLRFHEERDVTVLVLRGSAIVEMGAGVSSLESIDVSAGQAFRIRPGVLHRITAEADLELACVSTPELDDEILVRPPDPTFQVEEGEDEP